MQSVYGDRFIGPFEALRLTYDERGRCVRRLYRGVYMNFIRSLLSWGIINSAYEKLKSITWYLFIYGIESKIQALWGGEACTIEAHTIRYDVCIFLYR